MIMSVIALGKIADRQRHPGKKRGNRHRNVGAGLRHSHSGRFPGDDIGRCLSGLALLYLGWHVVILFRSPGSLKSSAINLRLPYAVLAVALISRMLLNGRIYHYGFYQAAIAGRLCPQCFWGNRQIGQESNDREPPDHYPWALLALLLPGRRDSNVRIETRPQQMKTYAVGDRLDWFYTFPPRNEPTGRCARQDCHEVAESAARRSDLVGIARGWMVNYLTRLRCPLAPFFYFNMFTENWKGARRCSSSSCGANRPISLSSSVAIYEVRDQSLWQKAPRWPGTIAVALGQRKLQDPQGSRW